MRRTQQIFCYHAQDLHRGWRGALAPRGVTEMCWPLGSTAMPSAPKMPCTPPSWLARTPLLPQTAAWPFHTSIHPVWSHEIPMGRVLMSPISMKRRTPCPSHLSRQSTCRHPECRGYHRPNVDAPHTTFWSFLHIVAVYFCIWLLCPGVVSFLILDHSHICQHPASSIGPQDGAAAPAQMHGGAVQGCWQAHSRTKPAPMAGWVPLVPWAVPWPDRGQAHWWSQGRRPLSGFSS